MHAATNRRPTVFLSYASEDRPAARRIGEALPTYGLEVWYDESELGGGDAWDQKIRRQIRDCDYFMALVSSQTEARHEGYFRREWRLAVERSLDMADDHTFLLPVVIDDTQQSEARVPERFLSVQWIKVPGGEPTPALATLCRRLVSGEALVDSAVKRRAASDAPPPGAASVPPDYPEFPREEPGQRMRFLFAVGGWALRSGWASFKRLPRWLRIAAYVWACIVLLSRGCSSPTTHPRSADSSTADTAKIEATADGYKAAAEEYKATAERYKNGIKKADIAKLGAKIAREFGDDDPDTQRSSLLALPFVAPAGDAAAAKLADSAFAQVYGRLSITHSGQVTIAKDATSAHDLKSALRRGRAHHSTYILFGTVESTDTPRVLTIRIVRVVDGIVSWSQSYPATTDLEDIAVEVNSKVPSLDE